MKPAKIYSSICNTAGCSAPSNVECLFTSMGSGLCTRPLPPPKPPTDIVFSNTYPLEVTWTPPKTQSGVADPSVTGYDVRLDDPWLQSGLQIVAHVTSPAYANQTVLPSAEYAIQIRATTPDDSSEWTSVKKVQISQTSACGNPDDVANWRLHYHEGDLVSQSQSCGERYFYSRSGCEKCLKDKLGLSNDCGSCWYDEGVCTVHNCKSACLLGSAQKCNECWDTNCSPAFQSCSGMPTWTYPPLRT